MKTNADGLPMKDGVNVPLTAGVDDEDPAVTLHDAAIPEVLRTKDGRAFNLRESHDFHERVEYAIMQAGLSYDDAHRYATEAEHKRARDLGFDPNEIELLAKPYINAAQHRAKAMGYKAHPTLDNQPYRDSGTEDDLNRGEEEDEREFYDKEGNCYSEPERYSALGKVDFIIAYSDIKKHFCAIEPSTATHWAEGKTRESAERAIEKLVRKHGLLHTKEMIDSATPWSQQQLQEIYDRDE